jgi:hypothetical protein
MAATTTLRESLRTPAGGTAGTGAAGPSMPGPPSPGRCPVAFGDVGGDLGRVLIGPGRLDELAADLDVAGLGQMPSLGPVAREVLTRDQPARTPCGGGPIRIAASRTPRPPGPRRRCGRCPGRRRVGFAQRCAELEPAVVVAELDRVHAPRVARH